MKKNRLSSELTEKQESFCVFYVIRAGCCGKRAAIMAGYAEASAHVRACRLMKKRKIKKRINDLLKEH
jgi:phage terminase small subunit